MMADKPAGIGTLFKDAWLVDGVRTPFVDYNGPLSGVSLQQQVRAEGGDQQDRTRGQ